MSRKHLFQLPLAFSGNSLGHSDNPLSQDCLRRLRYALEIVNEIDSAVLNEWNTLARIENSLTQAGRQIVGPEWLFTADEKQQMEDYSSDLLTRQKLISSLVSESSIKKYLSQHVELSNWRIVSTAMSRTQDRDVDGTTSWALSRERQNRATTILDLGVSLIEYLDPIKLELQTDAADVLFAIRLRLNGIKAFHPIYEYVRTSMSPNKDPHLMIDATRRFRADIESPSNAVRAYAAVDKSVQATLIAATMIALAISVIPTYFAWQRSSIQAGTKNDSDFWASLQVLFVQLLGLFTMMWPVSRFAPFVAWQFSWAFAAMAGFCAVATPVLYVTAPVGWSVLASYFASVAQAAVVLQVMLGSNFTKVKDF